MDDQNDIGEYVRALIREELELMAAASRGIVIRGKTARSLCCGKVLVIGQRFDGEVCASCLFNIERMGL